MRKIDPKKLRQVDDEMFDIWELPIEDQKVFKQIERVEYFAISDEMQRADRNKLNEGSPTINTAIKTAIRGIITQKFNEYLKTKYGEKLDGISKYIKENRRENWRQIKQPAADRSTTKFSRISAKGSASFQ